MSPDDLLPGTPVRVVIDSESITGTRATVLASGTVAALEQVRACSRTTLIPIHLETSPTRIVWVRSGQILD